MKAIILPILISLFGMHSTVEAPNPNEQLAQEMKSALSSIYNDRSLSIGPLEAKESGGAITLSGEGELFKDDIRLEGVFTTGGDLLRIKAEFKERQKMNPRTFQRISKGPKANNWFPKPLQKGMRIQAILLEFKKKGEDTELDRMKINNMFINSWSFLGTEQIRLKDITGQLIIDDPQKKKKTSAALKGILQAGNTEFLAEAARNNSGADWILSGLLEELPLGAMLEGLNKSPLGSQFDLPEGIRKIQINNARFTAYPNRKKFSLEGESNLGKTQILIQPKDKAKGHSYYVGFAPNPGFKYGSIHQSMEAIDLLKLSNSGLVLASDASGTTDLEIFKRLGGSPRLNRGLNIVGQFDLTGVGLDRLLGLESLLVRGVFSNRPEDLLLEGSLSTNISFGKAATFKELFFGLKPDPQKMEISLGGLLDVQVGDDLLQFSTKAGIDAADQALFIEGSMSGDWNNPFNTKGLRLSDLWIRVGASFRTTPIPLPELGIAGKLKAGDFEGDMMVFLNLNNPSEAALDAGFNKLSVGQLLRAFCDPKIEKNMDSDMRQLVNSIHLEETRLSIVPKPMMINNTNYEAGFRVKGKGAVAGINASMELNIDYTNGIQAKAASDPIHLPPYFSLTGAAGSPNPYLDIDLRANSSPRVALNGTGTVLGITAGTDVQFSTQGFSLMMRGKVFDAFAAKLQLKGNSLTNSNGAGFFAAVTMEQEFLTYITKWASKEIDEATKETQKDFRKAQNTIAEQKRKLKSINGNIAARRAEVKKERDANIAKWNKAADAIAVERGKLDAINANIKSANDKKKAAKSRITSKEKWVKEVKGPLRAARLAQATPFFTEQNAIIVAQDAAIVTQKGYQKTAQLALKGAEAGLRGLTPIHELPPVDSDPELIALFTARDGANTTLTAAQVFLKAGEVVSVGTLKGTKWIVENGPEKVADIKYAHFEGGLNTVSGGQVKLRLKGKFAGDPLDTTISFDFGNPLESIKKFAEKLVK